MQLENGNGEMHVHVTQKTGFCNMSQLRIIAAPHGCNAINSELILKKVQKIN